MKDQNLKNRVEIGETLTFRELTDIYEDIYDVLSNIDEKVLLSNRSVSFLVDYDSDLNLNVEFEIQEEKEDPLDTVVKITNVEYI